MKIGEKLPFPLSMQVDYERPSIFSKEEYPDLSKKATRGEKALQEKMRPSTSLWKDGLRRFVHNPVAMVCAVVMLLLIIVVIFGPMIVPYDYQTQLALDSRDGTYIGLAPFSYSDTEKALMASGQFVFPHIFGTDSLGRDYFSRVLQGTRLSLLIGFFAALIVLVIGSIYGAVSGYIGGKTDLVMMRIVDIIYSFPDMVLILILAALLRQVAIDSQSEILTKYGGGIIAMFVVFALLYWVGMARLVRGQVLSLKQQEYVLAARSIGASPAFIIKKHLLPNSMSVIIISAALQIPSAIFTESFLSYLGLGVNAPLASLGSLCSENQSFIYSSTKSYLLFIPALMICIIVLCLNLIGDGLRDAFDPKMKR